MVEIAQVAKVFRKSGREIRAVDGLSWRVPPGTLAVVFGKSGSGKSTLLMMLGGMLTPTEGRVLVGENDLYAQSRSWHNRFRRRSGGFIFQRFHLLPYFTVYENITVPLAMSGAAGTDEKVRAVARTLGLSERMEHLPAELSIGQQQRVAMARAIVHGPDLILADEPTGNLDAENTANIVDALRSAARSGKTVVVATHDTALLDVADCKLHLTDGRGEAAP